MIRITFQGTFRFYKFSDTLRIGPIDIDLGKTRLGKSVL